MMRDVIRRLRISRLQILGVILMAGGLSLLMFSGAYAVKNSKKVPDDQVSEIETTAPDLTTEVPSSGLTDAEVDIEVPELDKLPDLTPLLIAGGLMILFSLPLFYAPRVEPDLRLPREYDTDTDEEEAEFDYPDDDYDYILDDEIRERLLEERRRKIKEMKKRRRRFLGRKRGNKQ